MRERLHFSILAVQKRVFGQALLGLVLPGWALVWSKRPMFGVVLGTTYCVSIPIFLIWRGYAISNLALVLMMTIHAGGILRLDSFSNLWMRCLTSFLVFFALAALIYRPVLKQIEKHWFVALRTSKHVVVVQTGTQHKIHRGDWVAYRIGTDWGRYYTRPVVVRAGYSLGQVLAVAGDEITFRRDGLLVAGEKYQHRPYMPTNRTIQVQERCWFVWPEMSISGHGEVDPGQIEGSLLALAMVPEADIVGVPYKRWFWRKQMLP